MTRNRRVVLDGLAKLLEAGAPEELFVGPDEEAVFLYELLVETARGRGSAYYWEICRTARRHRVTPAYVVDRAVVLHAAIAERRRTDLYRILGVPPLASVEVIRQRWIDLAKRHHPDVGGDGSVFRHLKQAYDVLHDAQRRAEYERFWLRALGPFERAVPGDDVPMLEATADRPRRPPAAAPVAAPVPVAAPSPPLAAAAAPEAQGAAPAPLRGPLDDAARLLAAREAPNGGGVSAVATLLGRVEAALAPIQRDDLERLAAEVARVVGELESIRGQLDVLAGLKHRLGA